MRRRQVSAGWRASRLAAAVALLALVVLAIWFTVHGVVTLAPVLVSAYAKARGEVVAASTFTQQQATIEQAMLAFVGSLLTAVVALTAAVATAAVALLSFATNYRLALRTRRDTIFFEALERFGDKDSPRLRAGGAQQMAYFVHERSEYRAIAVDQLLSGGLIEDDSAAAAAIARSIRSLARPDLVERLYESNIELQRALVTSLALVCAYRPASASIETGFARAEIAGGYSGPVFQHLSERSAALSLAPFETLMPAGDTTAERDAKQQAALERLRVDCERLRHNVDMLAAALTARRPQATPLFPTLACALWRARWYTFARIIAGAQNLLAPISPGPELSGVFLVGASLPGTNLRHTVLVDAQCDDADLGGADLHGAALLRASLERANVMSAVFDEATMHDVRLRCAQVDNACFGSAYCTGATLRDASWWTANFDESATAVIDTRLPLAGEAGRGATRSGGLLVLQLFEGAPPPAGARLHPSLRSLVPNVDQS